MDKNYLYSLNDIYKTAHGKPNRFNIDSVKFITQMIKAELLVWRVKANST